MEMENDYFFHDVKCHNWEQYMESFSQEVDYDHTELQALQDIEKESQRYIDVDYSILELVTEIKSIKQQESALKDKRENLEMELRGAIGSHEYALYGGEIVATLKTIHKKEHFVKASSYRELRIK